MNCVLWNKGFNHKQKLCELNLWTSNKKQQNECVLWNKGFNHKQKALSTYNAWDIKQEATKQMCIVEQGTLQ
jgi:hypothetical protein